MMMKVTVVCAAVVCMCITLCEGRVPVGMACRLDRRTRHITRREFSDPCIQDCLTPACPTRRWWHRRRTRHRLARRLPSSHAVETGNDTASRRMGTFVLITVNSFAMRLQPSQAASMALAVMRCLSVTFEYCVKTSKHILKLFHCLVDPPF